MNRIVHDLKPSQTGDTLKTKGKVSKSTLHDNFLSARVTRESKTYSLDPRKRHIKVPGLTKDAVIECDIGKEANVMTYLSDNCRVDKNQSEHDTLRSGQNAKECLDGY